MLGVAITLCVNVVATAAAPALPKQCQVAGKVLCISKQDNKLRFVVDGRVRLTMDARFGDGRGPQYKTVEGSFKILRKIPMDYSREFQNAPMPYSMYFHGGEAIHYSYSFAAEGYKGNSHGCVNTRNMSKLRWLYSQVALGTPVYIYS